MANDSVQLLQGSLDLIVLQALSAMGPLHAYALAARLEQVSDAPFSLNQGTLYPALLRLQQRGFIASNWGLSENNRRAKFYSLTRAGKRQLAAETENWERIAAVISRMLQGAQEA